MIPEKHERSVLAGVSLLLSIFLWFYVVGHKEREWSYAVPVDVALEAPDATSVVTPSKVSVRFKGSRRAIDEIDIGKLRINLDLAEREPGEYTRSIKPEMLVGVTGRLEIVRMEPSEVRIEIQQMRSARVPVKALLRIITDPGFAVKEPVKIDPAYVQVTGAPSELISIAEVVTEDKQISSRLGIWNERLRILPPKGTSVYPLFVDVTYEVATASEIETAPGTGDAAPPPQ